MKLNQPLLGLAVGAALFASAPVVLADDDDDRDDRDRKDGGDLVVIGLTQDQQFIAFEEDDPEDAKSLGRVTGLVGDTKLVGVDFRPATGTEGKPGTLYGVGDAGGIYTFTNSTRGTKVSQLSVPLEGTSFGVDFNPAVDRLRIISDTGQNLRDNVDANGDTIVDGRLTNPATPPATAPVPANGVTGAAYTNNDGDPNTATTLFDVDSALDRVSIQSPANAGTLAPTGNLGVNTDPTIGSDIYATIRNGTTVDNRALASLTVGSVSRFYRLDLLTGRATLRGTFPSKFKVTGIAIPLNQL